jgi:preprotein translocase subunit SecA
VTLSRPRSARNPVGTLAYMTILERALRVGEAKKFKEFEKKVARIGDFEPELELETDDELRRRYAELRERYENGESLDDLLPESFALTREAAKRSLGQRHFDVQLIGGMVLHDGNIAEMKTGEGKTLTATLAVVLNAIPREGIHVVTVNDYLARRDANWMKPIYDMLGVTVGVIQSDDRNPAEKQAAYQADVTYGTNSEFGFDYLRDNLAVAPEDRAQRGHFYGIVDEVDNILIDEARTPLIISGQPEQAADLYYQFAKLAKTMRPGKKPEGFEAKQKDWEADYDFEPDEKHKTVAITEKGADKAARFLGQDLWSAENGHLYNHLQQALKAESLYKKDVDYAVIDGEVMIIDEFTGRILEGRRWSEGLHQAVEAKEGVAIQEENQTVATITYQNYFRRYDKLAGMTGTALTEATEFMKIYDLQVVEVPTNMPMVRKDQNDQIYKTKDGKWSAVIRQIKERHEAGQPVLVGTISVEVSELVSEQLSRTGVPHTVLNAKPEHAEREAEIVAEAGQPGAVTIATNMAGRGVDIKLGGNPEHLTHQELLKLGAEPDSEEWEKLWDGIYPKIEARVEENKQKVLDAGGLFILGTERHESRRIDNQLRGRSGRQGDPGESRFYLSAEDDLVRLFAGDRIYRILDRLGPVDKETGEEEPIEAKMLSGQIEKAQRRVEEQNFLIRKHTLEYDDVMNEQREVIYRYRNRVLDGEDISDTARSQIQDAIERLSEDYLPGDFPEEWDLDGLFTQLEQIYPTALEADEIDPNQANKPELIKELRDDIVTAYEERESELGEELMRALERFILLQVIDERWREHLHDIDYMREGIHLRGFAQEEPLVAYKNEAFQMFRSLIQSIWEEFARIIFNVEVEIEQGNGDGAGSIWQAPTTSTPTRGLQYAGGGPDQPSALAAAAAAAGGGAVPAGMAAAEGYDGGEEFVPQVIETVRREEPKIGRNDPCWCGSGKKYKKCHGAAA